MIAVLVSAGLATLVTFVLARQSAPLGVPVPPPPPFMFNVTEGANRDSSFIKRTLPMGWLLKLAPQPDGLPYPSTEFESGTLGFRIRLPYGAENVQYGPDDIARDGVVSQARVRIDQPIAAVKVSFPTKDPKQKQVEYGGQLLDIAVADGATPTADVQTAALPGGGFVTLAYRKTNETGDYVHLLYIVGVAARALVFDFMLPPAHEADGRRYAEKVMRTFEPGPTIEDHMELGPTKPEETFESEVKPEPAG